MDFMTMVKDKWIIFLVIGLFLVGAIVISEVNRRREKKAIEAKSAVSEQKDK